MASGKQIYSKIEEQVNQLDRVKSTIESELRHNQRAQQTNEAKRLECMSTIAAVHVDALLDSAKTPVRAVTGEVDALIGRRDKAYNEILQQMDRSRTELRLADSALEKAQADFEATRARVYETLAKSGDFIEKRRLVDEAEKQVSLCQTVFSEISAEAQAKLPAYRNSPFFQYLMGRQFGTTEYAGKSLFKRLDAWIGKKIDYTQAKHDFDILNQLPGLAETKLQEARLIRDRATDNYRIIEQQIRRSHRYEEAEKAIGAARDKRDACREQIAEHHRSIDAYQTKNDSIMGLIKTKVQQTLSQFSLATIDRLTKETGSRSDDLALHQYQQLVEDAPRLEEQEREIQARLQKAAQDFKKAKTLRDTFVSNNYDSSRREFDAGFNIDRLIAGYLIGQFSLNDFDRNCSSNSSIVHEQVASQSQSGSLDSSGGGGEVGYTSDGFSGASETGVTTGGF